MRPQRLPLPIGSPHPVRRQIRPVRFPRVTRRQITILAGVAAAALGAVLGLDQPAVTVAMDDSSYRVGDVVLPAQGRGIYAGPGGAVVFGPDGMVASGSTQLHGVKMLGSCRLAPDLRSERCSFDLGGRTLSADDRLDGMGWDRRYQDARQVRISLANGHPIPVPIALGR